MMSKYEKLREDLVSLCRKKLYARRAAPTWGAVHHPMQALEYEDAVKCFITIRDIENLLDINISYPSDARRS